MTVTETMRAHPTWPAHPGVEVGCDDIDCGTCYVQWWQEPLRDGEYDVAVMFRVSGDSAEAARQTVARIVKTDQFEKTSVGMYVPAAATAFVLDRAENPHPRMLAEALELRRRAITVNDGWYRAAWRGYLQAMCAATGETPEAIEAWMDRAG